MSISAFEEYCRRNAQELNRLSEITNEENMNEQQALHAVLQEAIRTAQNHGEDLKECAEEAARAFKAGLAAFNESANPSASELTLKVRIEAS